MNKITCTFAVLISTYLFTYSSYAMQCCGCGEEAPEKTNLVKKTRREQQIATLAQLEEVARREREKLEKKEKQKPKNGYHRQKDEPKNQEISHGTITLTLPRDVTALLNTDGSKSITYGDISIQMFENHKDVILNNTEVNALQKIHVTLKEGKESLKRRMKTFLYDKIEEKKDSQNKETYDGIVLGINTILDTLTAEDLQLVKLTHADKNTTFISFFKVKKGALLIKGHHLSPVGSTS